MGCKVNLGFLIIQHMSKVLTSSRSILPYGMLLTLVFQSFGVDLDSEVDLRMSKPSDYIDNACISRLGYEFNCRHRVDKVGLAPAMVDIDSDEEAEMDISPPSPTAPVRIHLLLLLLLAHHQLHQIGIMIYRSILILLILTCELSLRSKIADLEQLIIYLESLIVDLELLIIILVCWSPSKLRFYVSCDLSFCHPNSLCVVMFVFRMFLSYVFMVCLY